MLEIVITEIALVIVHLVFAKVIADLLTVMFVLQLIVLIVTQLHNYSLIAIAPALIIAQLQEVFKLVAIAIADK